MAHTPHKSLQSLIDDIKIEDYTAYLEFITKVNSDNLENYQAETLLKDEALNTKLTDNQIELLKVLNFKGGTKLWLYRHPTTSFTKRWDLIQLNTSLAYNNDLDITKEDLKFTSKYYQSKWKQANPTSARLHAKGLQFEFNMDEFSLNIFKNSIKKPFLRTEAKNLVLKVNKAFNKSRTTNNSISIRNRFYAIILDNTPIHTKAMLNELYPTILEKHDSVTNTTSYYTPHKDEAIAVELGFSNRDISGVPTPEAMKNYSSDTAICTHMKLEKVQNNRLLKRYYTATSIMSTLAIRTNNNTYKDLAARMVSNLTDSQLVPFHGLTQSVGMLNTLIETNINNKEK